MKTQFTSGLYIHPDSPTLVRRESDDATVAQMDDGGHPNPEYCDIDENEQAANAQLFAAAPDLYEALKLAKTHIEHMAAWISDRTDGYSFEALGEDMPSIDAAIAKATSA